MADTYVSTALGDLITLGGAVSSLACMIAAQIAGAVERLRGYMESERGIAYDPSGRLGELIGRRPALRPAGIPRRRLPI